MDSLLKALKAAAEVTRLRILAALAQSELTVTELVVLLGQSQPRVSRHLKLMVEAGLLTRYQEGSWVFHRLNDQPAQISLARNLADMIDYADPILQQDSERLKEIKQQNADLAAAYFKDHAKDWDKLREYTGSATEIEAALLAAAPKPIDLMVDLGTGTGRILQIFSPHIQRGVGYDASHEMLNVARANLDQAKAHNCQVRQSDIRSLPLDKHCADLVTIHQVLHYLNDPAFVFREASRVLKRDALFLVVDFAQHQQESFRTDHAHRRLGFSDIEIEQWCSTTGLQHVQAISLSKQKDHGLTVKLWVIKKR